MTYRAWIAAGTCLLLGAGSATAAPADKANCATDGTIDVCVVSGAISLSTNTVAADVFVTLRITNQTSDPLQLTMCKDMSFAPENAPGLTPMNLGYIQVSGMSAAECERNFSAASTTFAPGRPLLVQIRYPALLSNDAKQMLRSATVASFTATLSENVGDKREFIPLPTPEFRFGNGFAKQ